MERLDVAYSACTFKNNLIGVEKPGVPVKLDGKLNDKDGK
jgi:hypothetical protein